MKFLQHTPRLYRSALTIYPGGTPPREPTVAVIIPIYNEIKHIQALVDAVLVQDYPVITEIWFIDGQSTDGTFEELQRIVTRDRRFRLLANPRRNQAAAINLGFARSRSDVVIRLDAHAQYAADVVRRSVEALLATGAGGVGAIARPRAADTCVSQGIVAAHKSKLGVGIAQFRQAAGGGWADTVWNGCYWKHIIDLVGPMREDLRRSEDNDFNARVRALGYGLYLSPDIEAYYSPRQTLLGLWEQYVGNGVGVTQALFENRQAVSLRHFVPFLFLLSLILPLMLASVWPLAWLITAAVLGLYLITLVAFSLLAYVHQPGGYAVILPLVFATLHISYGFGSVQGFLQATYRAWKRIIHSLYTPAG